MNHLQLIDLLIEAGFNDGWTLEGETLIGWEHDADPPAPLQRPTDNA